MKATAKIISAIASTILALGLFGCAGSNGSDDAGSDSPENAEAAAGNTAAVDEYESPFDRSYVEIGGETISISDWTEIILSNQLALDNYIGKEMTVVSEFQWISQSDPFYFTSYEQSKSTVENIPKYDAPVGMMTLLGSIYVDIPESDQAIVSTLKQGDMVRVQGTLSGFSPGATYMFASGTEYSSPITIEKA